MLKIENTKRFIQNFKQYRQDIDQINDDVTKERAEKLLSALRTEYRLISEAHNPANSKSIDPRTARDSIEQSVTLRRKLDQLIKDSKGY